MRYSPPILVTGIHRSGTTWVGKTLAADAYTTYVSEPLNIFHRPGVFRAPVRNWYTYITDENEIEYMAAFEELLRFQYQFWPGITSIRSHKHLVLMLEDLRSFFTGRIRGRRMLLKDPFAVFSSPWFAERLNCQIVVMVRHPAAFASSVKRLGWDFDFRNLLEQPLLMRDYLEDHRTDMESMHPDDVLGQGALLWKLVYRFVDSLRARFPQFLIVRHEDISLDPVAHYRRLYERLGLEYTERVRNIVRESSSSENPATLPDNDPYAVKLDSRASLENWKRILTPGEVERVRNLTEGVSGLFYAADIGDGGQTVGRGWLPHEASHVNLLAPPGPPARAIREHHASRTIHETS